eukprot:GHVL01007260.1.p1 GENE.GHVL01007260.1~~GHVL01007260.1.p1  ORF type:complete len:240 (-),score=28.58 GHVL01007260.1:160-879(-)
MSFFSNLFLPAKCETIDHPRAYPEHAKKAVLTPKMDNDFGYGIYHWGYEPIPMSAAKAVPVYYGENDNMDHQRIRYPWVTSGVPHHQPTRHETDRINPHYYAQLEDHLPKSGWDGKPSFSTQWEKLLAHHHGLYDPKMWKESRSEDDIRLNVAHIGEIIENDDPKDACKWLQLETFRCREVHQSDMSPAKAMTKCLKYDKELDKCKWDSEKITKGYTWIERRRHERHRLYYLSADYQYS